MTPRKPRQVVVDVQPGETEEHAIQRHQKETAMPIDDLEMDVTPPPPQPPALKVDDAISAARDLVARIRNGEDPNSVAASAMGRLEKVVQARVVDARAGVVEATAKEMEGADAVAVVLPFAPAQEGFRVISLDAISESPTNPRRDYGDLQELATSIRTHGVVQPILVVPSVEEGKPFRLVSGHRRLRAARMAGLTAIPATIHAPMTEAEVLEVQLVENCQRKDIHELDEAEAYQRLISQFGYTVGQIAEKIGKSKRTVWVRLQLNQLDDNAREAFLKGMLTPSTAMLVARVPKEMQGKAVAALSGGGEGGQPLSFRQAQEYVQTHFMLTLGGAPFDTSDDMLVPAAGACKACPKRSGNARDLFDDVKAADVCTDPICYRSKVDAAWEAQVARAEGKGYKVLPRAEGARLYKTGKLQWDGDFVERNAACPEDTKRRTWQKLADWAGVEAPVYIAADGNGMPHELLKKSDLDPALAALGAKRKASTSDHAEDIADAKPVDKEKAKEEKKARQVRQAVSAAMMGEVIAQLEKKGLTLPSLRLIAHGLIHMCKPESVLARRDMTEGALEKAINSKMNQAELTALIFELATAEWIGDSWSAYSPELKVMAKTFSVDLKKLEKVAAAEADLGLGKKAKAKS